MSKRLQVLLDETEFREIEQIARCHRITVAEWVRQALRAACGRETLGDSRKKLAVIRAATQHAFPVAEIELMLAEIEKGSRGTDG